MPAPYRQVAIGTGSRQVHVAGQLRNTGLALAAADAGFHDVVRMTSSVTQWSPEQMGPLMAGIGDVAVDLAP